MNPIAWPISESDAVELVRCVRSAVRVCARSLPVGEQEDLVQDVLLAVLSRFNVGWRSLMRPIGPWEWRAT